MEGGFPQAKAARFGGNAGGYRPPGSERPGGGGGSFTLPEPSELLLVESALRKLEGRDRTAITRDEAEAVRQVCWEKASRIAQDFCRASRRQKDYPSSALRRLLHTADRYLRHVRDAAPGGADYGPQAALVLLGSEVYHLARTTSKPEARRFFVACGDLATKLARHNPCPTGRGLEVFLERVICFAERYRAG